MPILIKDYSWTESISHVYLTVPLKGANPKKTDVYVNDVYVKVNFPPYFFELDLHDRVDGEAAVAILGNGCAKLELPKQEPGFWTTIILEDATPASTRIRREEADKRFRERADAARAEKAAAKRAEEQLLIQKQIEVERADRERIAQLKQDEKSKAEADLRRWTEMAKDEQARATVEASLKDKPHSEVLEIFENHQSDADTAVACAAGPNGGLEEDDNDEAGLDMASIFTKVRSQTAQARKVPPPRAVEREITIRFTSRGLKPTKTARESEDAKWDTRIKAMQDDHARKTAPSANEDARGPEESNPLFLKDKGNVFYRSGNFESAVNAYTAALDLDPHNLPCLSNRAACHLQLSDYSACIADCAAGLALLDQEDVAIIEKMMEDNGAEMRRKARVKLLVRMGTAKVREAQIQGAGLAEYQQALELDPKNEALKADLCSLQVQCG
ncbi:Dynein assembly factor 4, axonemal [Geranomyces michiganensis]|nr:Dynein assembly factor 4, axonemal [Geranomyces michiganensis]